MPKVIKDIENKIFVGAMELFEEKGYQAVDMKNIAKKVGIAVGTLYNYYPNKEALYTKIFHRSWETTMERLGCITEAEGSSREKLYNFYDVFEEEVRARKGLGGVLIGENAPKSHCRDYLYEIQEKLYDIARQLILNVGDEESISIDLDHLDYMIYVFFAVKSFELVKKDELNKAKIKAVPHQMRWLIDKLIVEG